MATIKSTSHKGLSLNVQYDYITLKTPNGSFTRSRYSSKASGKLAANHAAFNSINDFITSKTKSLNLQQSMELLLRTEVLSKLFPGFNDEVVKFSAGDRIKYNGGYKKFAGKVGEIKRVSRKYADVLFPGESSTIGIEMACLEKAK